MACEGSVQNHSLNMRILILVSLAMGLISCGSEANRSPAAPDAAKSAALAPRTCPQCGQAVPDQAKYCLGCGTRQKPSTTTPGSR
jgi:hypothetical protein